MIAAENAPHAVPATQAEPSSPLRLPLLASTHFCLDVLLQGCVLDLESVLEVIAFDPCACARVLAAGARLNESPEERWGLQECVIALGRTGLVQALLYQASTWTQQARLHAFATQTIAIGRAAETLAPALAIAPSEAYTVGLLHALDRVPLVLAGHEPDPALIGFSDAGALADFPAWLEEALASLHSETAQGPWLPLLLAAHEVTGQNTEAPTPEKLLRAVCRCGVAISCDSLSAPSPPPGN